MALLSDALIMTFDKAVAVGRNFDVAVWDMSGRQGSELTRFEFQHVSEGGDFIGVAKYFNGSVSPFLMTQGKGIQYFDIGSEEYRVVRISGSNLRGDVLAFMRNGRQRHFVLFDLNRTTELPKRLEFEGISGTTFTGGVKIAENRLVLLWEYSADRKKLEKRLYKPSGLQLR